MKQYVNFIFFVSLFVILNISFAYICRVPGDFDYIQDAISSHQVQNGDTVSIWGNGDPPFTYPECISFMGKNILVSNRAYVEPGYPAPNPSQVIITREGATPPSTDTQSVVRFVSSEDTNAVLKGFTIERGRGTQCEFVDDEGKLRTELMGGGIFCYYTNPTIENCLIRFNHAEVGGGIGCRYASPTIRYNEIYEDTATVGMGSGGINSEGTSKAVISENIIRENSLGGVRFNGALNNPTVIANAIIENDSDGLAINSCAGTYRDNIIQSNGRDGVNCLAPDCDVRPDFGNIKTTGPGYNEIRGNRSSDFNNKRSGIGPRVYAEGNYWGSIDYSNIRSRIKDTFGLVDFDPIAVSDRVANVSYNSHCSTDVIVTGDLTINSDITLTIAPGKTFKFTTTADTNTGDYSSCELLVNGKIHAMGTASNKIKFTSNSTSPQLNDWYGIRLMPNSVGSFVNCTLKYAYCGIQAGMSDTLLVDSSLIESNQVYGIKMSRAKSVQIRTSKINANIYGIYSQFTAPTISDNEFLNNTRYGILFTDTTCATITGNQISCGPFLLEPTLYGVEVGRVGEGVIIDSNKMNGWSQGGVYIRNESQAQMNKDSIFNNTCYGILCRYSSSPKVRLCVINNNDAGVFCDDSGYPDLGTEEDPGYNSIDTSNIYLVDNKNPDPQGSIKAEKNWWGTDKPDSNKFIGLVDFYPWLTEPPEDGGEQSAGTINPTYPFILYAPKPNPATKEVKIAYSLPNRCKTELTIYNTLGKAISKTTEEKEAGRYEYLWNSREFPNGVYIIRLRANDKFCTQKVVISK